MSRTREQELIDTCFQLVLTAKMGSEWFLKLTTEQAAEWVAEQLAHCGFPTIPIGMCWGLLTTKEQRDQYLVTQENRWCKCGVKRKYSFDESCTTCRWDAEDAKNAEDEEE